MSSIERFVDSLSRTDTAPTLFNPFNQLCPIHDRRDAQLIRQRNLSKLLHAHQQLNTSMLWVFEAPSYLGARRSGAPFVNEDMFTEVEECLGMEASFEKATTGEAATALTTRLTWNLARDLDLKPLIWEALPFHPHYSGAPLTNRRPTSAEVGLYKHFLLELLNIFSPDQVFAVGRVAERALQSCGVQAAYIRHPAQGGAAQFRQQMWSYIE